MQANSLTIFMIRQTIRECQSDEAKKHPPDTMLSNKSQKLRHLNVWFYENEDKQILKKKKKTQKNTNTQTSNN